MQIPNEIRTILDEGVSPFEKLADKAMTPLMRYLQGSSEIEDSPQETHAWHGLDIDPSIIPQDKLLFVPEDLKHESNHVKVAQRGNLIHSAVTHMPRFGGWNKYVVIGAEYQYPFYYPWHLGWVESKGDEIVFCQVNKLRVYHRAVKALTGEEGSTVGFFAINDNSEFMNLSIWGHGIIGDGQYSDIRLF